jgi:CII-binding regulator of phage lambda lysogenization HflD
LGRDVQLNPLTHSICGTLADFFKLKTKTMEKLSDKISWVLHEFSRKKISENTAIKQLMEIKIDIISKKKYK